MRWQRRARLIIAIAVVAFAIVVALSLRRRTAPRVEAPLVRTDPQALVESAGGQTLRLNREHEEIRITYDKLLSYANGSSKMLGVTVVTERAGGRTFTITSKEAQVGDKESNVALTGDVRIVATDGMEVKAGQATYAESDGVVHAPGPVQFSRGRTTGSGIGFTYNKNLNILTILDQVRVRVMPDQNGAGAMEIEAGALQFQRTERIMRFDRMMKATREREVVEANAAVGHLSADEERLETLELRGNSRITGSKPAVGGLQALTGRDIDLKYAPDGVAIQHALITGEALIQIAGATGQAGRQIAANTVDVTLAADGATPTRLTARENVRLVIPDEQSGATRTITAQALDSTGDERRGLSRARFAGTVQFSEHGSAINRVARSGLLDVALAPGFSAIEEARFAQGVRFVDGDLTATAAVARYVLNKGTLELTGSEPGSPTPHMVNTQLTIDAARIDVALEGPDIKAAGKVKSVLQPKQAGARSAPEETRVPSMLKQDQPVNVTADTLSYTAKAAHAIYTGNVQLWQGDTTIKAASITIDSRRGDLVAAGPVTTTSVMAQERKDGTKERTRSVGSAKQFRYDDANRRATYEGDAHLSGPQGDTVASRIELFLEPSGDEVERAEAYGAVTLRDQNRKTTGNRLTYRSADESYVVSGTPVSVLDECGRETVARTLTFFRTTDRIIVDGNEQVRTQTKGKSNCP
jgi:LPS export ABC transporter protein LptC/lipopolysaccharide transport protein LptA